MLGRTQLPKTLLNEVKQGVTLYKAPPTQRLDLPHSNGLQALDNNEFESEYKQGKVDLISFKLSNNPIVIEKAVENVPAHEKQYIKRTYYLSSIGLGLSSTIGILLKFLAPVAVGGAGFAVATSLFIGLTAGCGAIALTLAFCAHRYLITRDIKTIGMLKKEIQLNEEKLLEKGIKIERELRQSFRMLVRMQLILENLKRIRLENNNHDSKPSKTEIQIKNRINNYIDFLVNNPYHPNLSAIENEQRRQIVTNRAASRQIKIRDRLDKACAQIQSGQTTLNDYIKNNPAEIRTCFPSLHLIAPKLKRSMRDVFLKPEIGLSFLGGFTGTFGLCYSTLGIITAFTAVSMAFPPLFAILGIALAGACFIGRSMYKIKKSEDDRKTTVINQQKYHAYLHRADHLLTERYTKELDKYTDYQSEILKAAHAKKPYSSPPSESKCENMSTNRLSLLQNLNRPQSESNETPPGLQPGDDMHFYDPSQITNTRSASFTPFDAPSEAWERSPR